MKKELFLICTMLFAATLTHAQSYNVGTSTTRTNAWGQQETTHKGAYGNTTGTTTSRTNAWGQREDQQKSNNTNTSIWTW